MRSFQVGSGMMCIAATLLAASAAAADSVTVAAVRDNTLFDSSPANLSNGAGAYMFAGTNANGQARRALIRFDLAAIPAGSTILSAQLQLYMSQSSSATGVLMRVHKVLSDWGEGTSNSGGNASGGGGAGATASSNDATWVHRFFDTAFWSVPGGSFAPSASGTSTVALDGFYSFEGGGLATDVQQWLSAPQTNYGWILLADEGVPRTARRFHTRENADPASRPQLRIDFVPRATPVPVPLWSLVAGGFGLLAAGLGLLRPRRRG